jgi:1-acyl-sn-glycerol-3-phosphate acyltransferase
MKKLIQKLAYLLLLYPIAVIGGSIFLFFRTTGRLTVKGEENLKEENVGTILVPNHPSLLEPVLLPFLYFPKVLWNPFKAVPWNTPDSKNFYKPWYFFWLRALRVIPINRARPNAGDTRNALQKIIDVLKRGETVIIFAEGGRTHKRKNIITSPKGKKLGKLTGGVERIVKECDCRVIPIWVEMPPGKFITRFTKTPIVINIGRPLYHKITTEELERAILSLADEI